MTTPDESPTSTYVKPVGVKPKAGATMVSFRVQMMVALTVVCALLYMIFSYVQENQILGSKLQQLHIKYNRAQTQRKTFETKYETAHSNEEMFKTSNHQLKLSLATTNKQLAETVGELTSLKQKYIDAHLFYKDIKEMLDIPDEVGKERKEKKVEPNIVKLIKWKLDQWKTRLRVLEDLQRNHTKLVHFHRSLKTDHGTAQERLLRLQEANAKMAAEKMKSTKVYDTLAQNYKNLTALYTKHADVNKKLRQKLRDFRTNIINQKAATTETTKDVDAPRATALTGSTATGTNRSESVLSNKLSSSLNHVTNKLKNMATNILPSLTKKVNDVKHEEGGIKRQEGDSGGAGGRSLDEEPKFEPEFMKDPIDSNGLGTMKGTSN